MWCDTIGTRRDGCDSAGDGVGWYCTVWGEPVWIGLVWDWLSLDGIDRSVLDWARPSDRMGLRDRLLSTWDLIGSDGI